MREFQINAAKHVNDLPIVLTRYNKPVITVKLYELKDDGLKTYPVKTKQPIKPVIEEPVEEVEEIEQPIGRCTPPRNQCRNFGNKYHVEYFDEDGLIRKDIYLCPIHLQLAKNQCEKVEPITI